MIAKVVDYNPGPCPVCGKKAQRLVVNYIHGEASGESCRPCAKRLRPAVETAGYIVTTVYGEPSGIWTPSTGFVNMKRFRKLANLDGVAEARLTTDPE